MEGCQEEELDEDVAHVEGNQEEELDDEVAATIISKLDVTTEGPDEEVTNVGTGISETK